MRSWARLGGRAHILGKLLKGYEVFRRHGRARVLQARREVPEFKQLQQHGRARESN